MAVVPRVGADSSATPNRARASGPSVAQDPSARFAPIFERAHRVHQLFSLAQDAATSNAALLDRIHSMTSAASGGGFAAVTQSLVGTTGRLDVHANETVTAIGKALEEIRSLETTIRDLEAAFGTLEERVSSIQETATKIADVAEMSHLLSLNARIEANRAGQQAAGFKVVAQEVGELARKTQSLSDEIDNEVSQIGESLGSFQGLFETNRTSLNHAGEAVATLEETAQGISSDTEVLVGVTRDVETLAHSQVAIQDGFDWLRRHGEWVEQSAAALVDGLSNECDAVDHAIRRSGGGQIATDVRRFRDDMVRALRDDLPDLGERAVANAISSEHPPAVLLQALAEASMDVFLGQTRRDEPLETYYRNGRILQHAVTAIEPLVPESFYAHAPVVVLGNAHEDYHDLGRRLVATSMRAAGFRVIDLGLSVSNETFVETAIREKADVIGVSSLLLHTAKAIPDLKQALVEMGRRDIGVIAGGAPFIVDPDMRKRYGADGVGRSPYEAIRLVRHLVSRSGRIATLASGRRAA
ncbi:MAG: cobalamin B12-binding domain-containing protein [Candidatus Eisenbacteria bacterium]|nr:cobalamin B12-binding domain-containing protein [Candidatus Eisenbacteria bacterium]